MQTKQRGQKIGEKKGKFLFKKKKKKKAEIYKNQENKQKCVKGS